jgi:membrane-associated protease RseP (regulator of RpoE activity)
LRTVYREPSKELLKMRQPSRSTVLTATLSALLLAGGGASLPATAQVAADPAAGKHAEKSKLICIGEDGQEKMIEGTGTVAKRGYLGVELSELTPELRAHFGAPQQAGVMVARVAPDSPAEKAGLKVGDIITSLDGKPVESSWDVRARVRPLAEGVVVPVEIWRDGKSQLLSATVAQKERREIDLSPFLMKGTDAERIMTIRRLPGPAAEGDALDGAVPSPKMHLPPPGVSPREELLEKQLKALEKRINELENRLRKQ